MSDLLLSQDDARRLAEAGAGFRPQAVVEARRLSTDYEWVSERGSSLRASAGDWLLSDGVTRWTVAAGVFEQTYVEIGPGRWAKTGTVCAVQLTRAVDVETAEGVAHGDPGDWLVTNPISGTWPVGSDEFRLRYVPI